MKPLPSHLPYVVLYVGTPTHRTNIPVHSPYFFLMANVSGTSMVANIAGVHTPSFFLMVNLSGYVVITSVLLLYLLFHLVR